VDLVVSFCIGVFEDITTNAQFIVMHDRHVVGLEVISRYLLHHMVLKLFKLSLSDVSPIPYVQRDLKRVEPLLNIWAHVFWRHVVFSMLNKVVVSYFPPVVNRRLIVREVEIMSRVNLQKLVDFTLQVTVIHVLKVVSSDTLLKFLKPLIMTMEFHRAICVYDRVRVMIKFFNHLSKLLTGR